MTETNDVSGIRQIVRVPTGIPGFDAIAGGGLPQGRSCLVTGIPGTGKTTFANQLAFAHAASGGTVIVVTVLTESHDVLLENLQEFDFFDAHKLGKQIHYMSLMTPLELGGLAATFDMLRKEISKHKATLLIIDGTAIDDDVALTDLDLRLFAQRLDTLSAFLGCTSVIITVASDNGAHPLWARVNGVVMLTNKIVGSRQVRGLEVIKMRASRSIGGLHEFSVTDAGITVFPRLEALVGTVRRPQSAEHGMGTGVPGLDAMLGGGLMPYSSTLVMGTPGVGKTILGLHFLVEGADRGERGLLAGFHETAEDLITTAERIGLDLRRHIDSGLIQVLWDAPLELSADQWAWKVLERVGEHAPARVYIDALTDVQRIITDSSRMPLFVTAFVNELRDRGATVLIAAELDAYTDERLAVPLPAASAAMDNCIILRHVEIRGEWRRVAAVPKARQSVADSAIRDVQITNKGMTIAHPVLSATGLLTGRATPVPEMDEGDSL